MTLSVGFLGLGKMGRPMTESLIRAGFDVHVLDPDADAREPLVKKGAKAAESAAILADRVDVAVTMLPTPDIVRRVTVGKGGLIEGNRIKVCVDMGTTGSKTVIEIAEALKERGIGFVDAPVTGAIKGARTGTLTIMASAPDNHLEIAKPVLEAMGKIHHLGSKIGLGQTMKLVNNMASAANMAVTCEVMVLGVKAGIDAQKMLDILNAGSGRNSASQDKFPEAIMPRTFDFGFPMDLQYKDLKLCMEEAEYYRVPMWVSSNVFHLWFHWLSQGTDKRDFTTIIEMLENWSGVKLRSSN